MKNGKYEMKYKWIPESRPDGYTKEDAATGYDGLCDAMLIVPILRSEDGRYGEAYKSYDGATQTELTDKDLFLHFIMLCERLNRSKQLFSWQKLIIQTTIDLYENVLEMTEIKE